MSGIKGLFESSARVFRSSSSAAGSSSQMSPHSPFTSPWTSFVADYSNEKAKAIDQKIFDLYSLSPEEREAIGYIDIK